MGKGKKRLKGVPVIHAEVKIRCNISLTPTAWGKLKNYAKSKDMSASEIIEQFIMDTTG
ncbi:MAG: hypothetical protein AAF915_26350 [Cyanobacteria bacterium P01_D01_bin.50]